MRFPNDTNFHLRMVALLIGALCLEQLAKKHIAYWNSPDIGVVTFAFGLIWVAMTAYHHGRATQERLRVVEAKLERLQQETDAVIDDIRARRALPKL